MQRILEPTKKGLVIIAIALIAVFVSTSSSSSASVAAADAAANYKAKCASCHGANGSGQTAYGKKAGLRDLRSAEVRGQGDAQLLAIISKGKGKMPGYEKSLGAAACQELVAFIKTLK